MSANTLPAPGVRRVESSHEFKAFFEQGIHGKYWDTDAGCVLETNQPVNQLALTFHARLYKRYRFYQKSLG